MDAMRDACAATVLVALFCAASVGVTSAHVMTTLCDDEPS
jgi:hypothetical protein